MVVKATLTVWRRLKCVSVCDTIRVKEMRMWGSGPAGERRESCVIHSAHVSSFLLIRKKRAMWRSSAAAAAFSLG